MIKTFFSVIILTVFVLYGCVAVPHFSPLVEGVLSQSLYHGLRSNNLNINTQYLMLLHTERNNIHRPILFLPFPLDQDIPLFDFSSSLS